MGKSLEYELTLKRFKSENSIKSLNWQGEKAEHRLKEPGKLTVIGEAQALIHRSKLTQQEVEKWAKQELYLFFLTQLFVGIKSN